jgi:hypothetical protein
VTCRPGFPPLETLSSITRAARRTIRESIWASLLLLPEQACELSSNFSAGVFVAVGRLSMNRVENAVHKQRAAEAITGPDKDGL